MRKTDPIYYWEELSKMQKFFDAILPALMTFGVIAAYTVAIIICAWATKFFGK